MSKSSFHYARRHPRRRTRAELWEAAREIFGRTLNGCGHRQIGMCLRAEHHVRITNKTVLRMMREMGLRCLIRRKKKAESYSSYKGEVGRIFPNKLNRDFSAERPMEKLGTDEPVAELDQ